MKALDGLGEDRYSLIKSAVMEFFIGTENCRQIKQRLRFYIDNEIFNEEIGEFSNSEKCFYYTFGLLLSSKTLDRQFLLNLATFIRDLPSKRYGTISRHHWDNLWKSVPKHQKIPVDVYTELVLKGYLDEWD